MTIISHDFIKAGVVMTGILTDNAIVEMICNTHNDCGINEIVKRMRNLLKNGQKNIDLIRIPPQVRILSRTENVGTGDLFLLLSLLWMMYLQ